MSSRIPKFPSTCAKRPNENALPHTQKRQRLEVPSIQVSSRKLQRAVSTTSLNNVGRFSEITRRTALQPQRSAGNLRQSMAATTASSVKRAPMGPPVSKPKKLPAWDLKGRIELMESRNNNLLQELKAYNERIAALEADKSKLNVDVATKAQQQEEASATVQNLQKLLQVERETSEQQAKRISGLEAEIKTLRNKDESLTVELSMKNEEISSLRNLVSTLTANRNTIEAELEANKASLSSANAEVSNLREKVANLEEYNSQLEDRLQDAEALRRRMHNTIQELKGNIRVFCRIRPPLPDEISSGLAMSTINVKDGSKALEIMSSTEGSQRNRTKYDFSFDHVFGASSTQDSVFLEISQLVQSVLDGYNVCIFAYGQTGSGKTYTMEGPGDIVSFTRHSDDPCLGMIPRSVHHLFSVAAQLEPNGWKYVMEASFMEIYNENIRDLLCDRSQGNTQKCEIKRANNGNDSYVSNVKTVTLSSEEEVYELLKTARVHRAVAATNCNERSSRSHYVFQIKLSGENSITLEKCEGILNLVDLAGSERIKESGSLGERLKEAKNINKSLSNLGNVIMALSQKADHIPYRNSKLTHLLMNSLGGNSKTLMFVNINPLEDSLGESVNSLRFAAKVNQCNIGTAQKRVK